MMPLAPISVLRLRPIAKGRKLYGVGKLVLGREAGQDGAKHSTHHARDEEGVVGEAEKTPVLLPHIKKAPK